MSIGINANNGTHSAVISDNGSNGFNGHSITKGGEFVVTSLDQSTELSIMPSTKSLSERHVSVVHPQEGTQEIYDSNPD